MSIVRTARPPVSVVMPFAGTRDEAWAAVEALGRLHVRDGDELLLADNAGALAGKGGGGIAVAAATGVPVAIARARGERSPAHARNAGAAEARPDTDWILFLDADTLAPADLIDRYFAEPIDDDVGAIAGAIRPAPVPGGRPGPAARYGAHKNFLDAGVHLGHPFLPRAAAANLLVRRAAFDWVGGFFEGLRAAEDTDFSWRLQQAGWRLTGCPDACVEHRYRDSVTALRRQWRGYAAGRAWLGRRYEAFEPRPALVRAGGRALGRVAGRARPRADAPWERPGLGDPRASVGRIPEPVADRVWFAVLDGILGLEELIGFAQTNRPPGGAAPPPATAVLIADRFPAPGVSAEPGARVEAAARADHAQPPPAGVTVSYREDDGPAERVAALVRLAVELPGPTLAALARDPRRTLTLAPAAGRLRADPGAAAATAGAATAGDTAAELERLARPARPAGRERRP